MKNVFYSIIIFLTINNAQAKFFHTSKITCECQVLDAENNVLHSVTVLPMYKSEHLLRINASKFLAIRWSYYKSPLMISVVEIPHYPWTFFESEIASEQIDPDSSNMINGTIDLSSYEEGYTLKCNEVVAP